MIRSDSVLAFAIFDSISGKALEWNVPLWMASLDLKKAFDRVKHSAAIQALKLQGASLQCVATFCAMMANSSLRFTLGGVTTPEVNLQRGLPQGAPESPLVFIMVVEMVMRPLIER